MPLPALGAAVAVIAASTGALAVAANAQGAASMKAGSIVPSSDFNGDGFPDLAMASPFEDVGLAIDAGAVHVMYSSAGGLQATAPDDQFWTQDSPDVEDQAEPEDRFGWSIADGDFNADGFADLAIGAFLEDLDVADKAGAVHVLYGSPIGLQATSPEDQFWTQDSPDVEDEAEAEDRFGRSLAAADFNGDGFHDLAVGHPFEQVGARLKAGGVNVLYGSPGGLQATSPEDQFWTQDSPDVEDRAEAADRFGWALVAGDFNGDGFAELAVGSPMEHVGGIIKAGAVNVLYGSAGGLQATAPEDQFWTQDTPGVNDVAQTTDRVGWYLSAGDFNGDDADDLVIGVPFEDREGLARTGAVQVLYGSVAGLQVTSPEDQLWVQDSPEVEETTEAEDWFGWSLGSGDLNGDGFDDLAATARLEDVEAVIDAGAVNVLYGSAEGLQTTFPEDQLWSQDSPDVEDMAESDDQLGWALVGRDFNSDGFDDLAAGVSLENVGTVVDAGAVHVLYGSPAGLQAVLPEDQFWTQDSPDVEGEASRGDQFGFSFQMGAQCVPPCHDPSRGRVGEGG